MRGTTQVKRDHHLKKQISQFMTTISEKSIYLKAVAKTWTIFTVDLLWLHLGQGVVLITPSMRVSRIC